MLVIGQILHHFSGISLYQARQEPPASGSLEYNIIDGPADDL